AGGHLHKTVPEKLRKDERSFKIDDKTKIIYPGSLAPVNFRELEQYKFGGFCIISGDIDTKSQISNLNVRYIPIKVKKVISLLVDCNNKSITQVQDLLKEKINETNFDDKTVTIRIYGTLSSGRTYELKTNEIIQKIKECSLFCNRILLTGSEPLFAPNCFDFIKFIHGVGKEIILETNGSFSIYKYLPYIKTICMDVKCPSSGMEGKTHWLNFNYLRPQDEVKFVIGNFEDFTYARTVVLKYQNRINQSQCVFSPAWGKIEPRALAEWILDDQLDVRFSLQEHKVIWGDKRGT
ncbi:MAG: hypothetical protein KAW92_03710, partial [Candidatus Cloacimonetes bacterium]|nr:hypothetical protein [Candidatus Cloacimonadota bacterium]